MTAPLIEFTSERPEDGPAISQLHDRVFGADRTAKSSYQFRRGVDPIANLAQVARTGDRIVGSIRYWPIHQSDHTPALLLGPLSVDPHWRGVGIGKSLVFTTLDMAAWAGHDLIYLVGDVSYYGQFHFRPALPEGVQIAGEDPRRILVNRLRPDAPIVPGPLLNANNIMSIKHPELARHAHHRSDCYLIHQSRVLDLCRDTATDDLN